MEMPISRAKWTETEVIWLIFRKAIEFLYT
jgi:hypothetical protein